MQPGALVRYDAMCTAIAECHSVDEVKDLRDKAMALELYAKQARNTDAERKASEVRLRAERRTGELLKDLAKSEGGRPEKTSAIVAEVSPVAAAASAASLASPQRKSPYRQAIEQAQIPARTAQRYQALADVPAPVFEQALRDPVVKPTTASLIREARAPAPKMPDEVLWLWGRMRDFERDGFADKEPSALLEPMTESMRADVARIAPLMAEFFTSIQESCNEHA